MKCEHANVLIMKYMDGEITENEAKDLNQHLLECPKCKESFNVFDSMLTDMEEITQVVAPEGFECQVMAKIMALPERSRTAIYTKKDKMKIAFAGTFTLLLSIGAILISYRDSVTVALLGVPYVGDAVQKLIPIATAVEGRTLKLFEYANQVMYGIEGLLTAGAGIFVLGIFAMCGVQFALNRRKNR